MHDLFHISTLLHSITIHFAESSNIYMHVIMLVNYNNACKLKGIEIFYF